MKRSSIYPIDHLFLDRWSPRAMSGEPIDDTTLMTLFEAAHWAPSAFNNQTWRFVYAKRDTPAWKTLFDLLVPFNQSWTNNAAALVVIISKKTSDEGKPSPTHSFDTGAAWMCLALQGYELGLVVHGMSGFDYQKAAQVLEVSDDYQVEAMCAIGKPGQVQDLPAELAQREEPSDRKPLQQVVFEGKLGK